MGQAARIAVTGANGFVGRLLTRHASERGWEVVGIVRSQEARHAVSQAGGRAVQAASGDVEGLARAFEGCRAVVHLAQIGAERGGQSYQEVNVGGTERVIEAMRRAGVGRIVFFSGLGVARYGMSRRCSNRYFLSKLAAELALFRSGHELAVFRPSYIVGPGDAFVPALLAAMAAGELERPGDGAYRLQPVAVDDAAAAVLAGVERPSPAFPQVFDLVGPEALSYARFLERLAQVARAEGRRADDRIREVPFEQADAQARAGGYQGMLADELDCLLCDEVSSPAPLEALLRRPLTPLDEALAAAVRAS